MIPTSRRRDLLACFLLVTANGAGNAVLSYITKLPNTETDVLAIVQASRSKGVK